jgi:hypothetical protein
MLLNVYLGGWLVGAIGVLAVPNGVRDRPMSRSLIRGSLAVFAGALWPVLVVGLVELIAVAVLARMMQVVLALPIRRGCKARGTDLLR